MHILLRCIETVLYFWNRQVLLIVCSDRYVLPLKSLKPHWKPWFHCKNCDFVGNFSDWHSMNRALWVLRKSCWIDQIWSMLALPCWFPEHLVSWQKDWFHQMLLIISSDSNGNCFDVLDVIEMLTVQFCQGMWDHIQVECYKANQSLILIICFCFKQHVYKKQKTILFFFL